MLSEYLPILILAGSGPAVRGRLARWPRRRLRPNHPNAVKLSRVRVRQRSGARLPGGERFSVKFYVVAMLFIIFDIETIFLFPWAVAFRELGLFGLGEMTVFIGLVFVAYVYVWRKGGLDWSGVTVAPVEAAADARVAAGGRRCLLSGWRASHLGATPEEIEEEVRRGILLTGLDRAVGWARKQSMWPATFGLRLLRDRDDVDRRRTSTTCRAGAWSCSARSPRQADLMIVAGRVSQKMAPVLRRIYDQMPEPRWVISMGVCASAGGMFTNYAIVQGRRHDRARRRLRSGLPAEARDADARYPDAAGEGPDGGAVQVIAAALADRLRDRFSRCPGGSRRGHASSWIATICTPR